MQIHSNQETYAAVDLGSNSFHLLVARREHGEMRVLDSIKEMVRLGGGLDERGNLNPDVRQTALECLSRFGQRLRGIPSKNRRAVGTQTFRRLHHAAAFLHAAEQALNCPVDIIAGREEARLVYLGVTQWVAGQLQRQLVIDIGGGSTELIIGENHEPLALESLQFGCVYVTRRFFPGGKITARRLRHAKRAVLAEMQEIQLGYLKTGWQTAVGSSGTFSSAAAICQARGWSDKYITRSALQQLKRKILSFHTISEISISGLSERRQPVFIGGLAIMLACFEALRIKQLVVSPYALREGLLSDLIGRLEHRDPREKAVAALMSRFSVDTAQATRVRVTALKLFDQIATGPLLSETHRSLLGWAADLHETGLILAHNSYQKHSGYLIESSDMAGFSQQEQLFIAVLVSYQRRNIPRSHTDKLPKRLHAAFRLSLICLRLAWIFCRTRNAAAIPDSMAKLHRNTLTLTFSTDWMASHPLTMADLEQERQAIRVLGKKLDFRPLDQQMDQ